MKTLTGLNSLVTFGKYQGKDWMYVYKNDPDYIMWVHNEDVQNIVFKPNLIDMTEKKIKGRKQRL